MRILCLEPYYGGSHRAFIDQWKCRSRHHWDLMTLPAHHWKWRMRHAGLWFAQQVRDAWDAGQRWDLIFCSDMLDLAQFKGLLPPTIAGLPSVIYFHENQLTYPMQNPDQRDLHFAFTNFSSALSADQVWFNSTFHRREFLRAVHQWLMKMPDYAPKDELAAVTAKCQIQSPGIERPKCERTPKQNAPLHIAWAARWEHDKAPGLFFQALEQLKRKRRPFRLIVCGQSFRQMPNEMTEAYERFQKEIVHWGYISSRPEYLHTLSGGDVFVSTAIHEFFGLSVLEAISLGLVPLLPDRLSYPELLSLDQDQRAAQFFYDGCVDDLARRLAAMAQDPDRTRSLVPCDLLEQTVARYQWSRRAMSMDTALDQLTS